MFKCDIISKSHQYKNIIGKLSHAQDAVSQLAVTEI